MKPNKKTLSATLATLASAMTVPAAAAPVIVNFTGNYNASSTLAGQPFTGSFSYDDTATPFSTTYNQDGSVNRRLFKDANGFFNITDSQGVKNSLSSNIQIALYYGATSTTLDVTGYNSQSNSSLEFELVTGDKTFGQNSQPSAASYASATAAVINSYGFTAAGGIGPLRTITAVSGAVAPVPEAATWAMMVGGMGIVGAAMRRRKYIPNKSKVTFG